MATMAAPAPNTSGLTWQQQEMLNSSSSRPQRKAATGGTSRRQKQTAVATQQAEASTSAAAATAAGKTAKARGGSAQTNTSSENSAEWQTQKTKGRGKNAAGSAKPADNTKQGEKSGIAASKPAHAKKAGASKSSNAAHDRSGSTGNGDSSQDDGLTWQQREFNAKAKANADTYSNQKDAETFGGGSPSQAHRGAAGLAKTRNEGGPRSSGASSNSKRTANTKARMSEQTGVPIAPSTPDKAAYAGPTFHNSPPASALPQPSFLLKRKQDVNGLASAGGVGPSPLATSDVVHGHAQQAEAPFQQQPGPGGPFANRGPPGDTSFPSM